MKTFDLTIAKKQASKIGVKVKKSTRKGKKLDVFDLKGNYLKSIGDINYQDFTVHKDPIRRQRYKKRFEKTRHKKGTASYYADKILW
jgi:hypothetical protein